MKPRNVQGGPAAVSARRVRGFSLLELMTVLVIVGVLAAIAWPSYQSYVIRSNRAAAQSFMMSVANRQEQYILTNRSYAASTAALSLTAPPETNGRYTFAVTNPGGATTYLVTATAIGNQVSDGDLTLSSDGTKTPADKWRK